MRDRLIELLDEAKYKALETIGSLNNGFGAWYADYLLANGVIVPPCKVWDKVYCIQNVFNDSTLQAETIVKTRIINFASAIFIAESYGLIFGERDFGETVFLTREEAEKALAERREDNGTES